MHEMGITQSIIDSAVEVAESHGATRIREIRISIGELTEIMEFALQFAFESLTPGTIVEGGTLVVTHVPARSRCNTCTVEYDHDRFQMVCPECGSFDVTLLTGREMRIDSIDAETPEGAPARLSDDTDKPLDPSQE